MKVAFFLENKNIQNVDFSDLLKGNPGCGGTEYLFALIPAILSEHIEIILFCESKINVPEYKNLTIVEVSSIEDCLLSSTKENVNFLVLRNRIKKDSELYSKVEKYDVKIIFWAHNSPNSKNIREINNLKNITAVVCVEYEQHLNLIDSVLHEKVCYIANPVPPLLPKYLTSINIEKKRKQTPLRKLGTPVDIANTIYFLLSNEAGHITKSVIPIDGGI